MSKAHTIFNRRTGILVFAALLPILVVVLVNVLLEWNVEVPSSPQDQNQEATEIAASLSAELNQIALLVIGGCAILVRECKGGGYVRGFLVAAVMVLSTAVASCFAGFRYRYVLAQHIAYEAFDFDAVSGRLEWQIWLLILALSGLIVLALLVYLPPAGSAAQPKPPKSRGEA